MEESVLNNVEGLDELKLKKEEVKKEFEEKLDIEQMADELGENEEEKEIISNLFYNSIKSLFDVGFDLAKNLNIEFILDNFVQKKSDNDQSEE